MIDFKNVGKSYGAMKVLDGISFRIDPGEFVCITGKSGAGKSTLLHLLTGAENISRGTIEVDGVDLKVVPPSAMQLYRRRLGIVFQDYKLLKNRTVAENIAFPLEVCGVADGEIAKRVKEVLAEMDLTRHAGTLPDALSGGEKARTAIGRAIVHDPMIVLADEPTGNIDPEQSVHVMKLFSRIHANGTTVIIATHDSALVDTLQTRVIELKEGKVARDSVGGYEKQKPGKAPVHGHGKHEVFEEPDDGSSGRRKVKVTAVHG